MTNQPPIPFPPEGPDEAMLIDYLYGALSPEAQAAVAAYLEAHPERRAELEAMQETRTWLQQQPPVPLPTAPVVLTPAPAPRRRLWEQVGRVAAVLLVLAMLAGLASLRVTLGEGEVRIGFGPPPVVAPSPDQLTQADLEAALARQRDSMDLALSRMESLLSQRPAPQPTPAFTRLDPSQLETLREELLAENTRRMAELLTVSQAYQQEATEDLLRQFSFYLEQQRTQDLELINYALNDLAETSGRQQQETAWLLGELMAQLQAP